MHQKCKILDSICIIGSNLASNIIAQGGHRNFTHTRQMAIFWFSTRQMVFFVAILAISTRQNSPILVIWTIRIRRYSPETLSIWANTHFGRSRVYLNLSPRGKPDHVDKRKLSVVVTQVCVIDLLVSHTPLHSNPIAPPRAISPWRHAIKQ